jgi:hypothetical protein
MMWAVLVVASLAILGIAGGLVYFALCLRHDNAAAEWEYAYEEAKTARYHRR